MVNNIGFRMQRHILNELNKNKCTTKQLAQKFARREDYIARQIGELQNNYLISHTSIYDDSIQRRRNKYCATSLGNIALQIVDNFSMASHSLQYLARYSNSDLIKDLAMKSIDKLESQECGNDEEPLRFSQLEGPFHDQIYLSAFSKLGVKVQEITKHTTSDEQLKKILDKECDIASFPSDGLIEQLKNKRSIAKDIKIIGVSRERSPTTLVKDNVETKDVYYFGGSARKKRALKISNKSEGVEHEELLKGVKESDFHKFVTNDPYPYLLQSEGDYNTEEVFYDYSYIVINSDKNRNSYIKKIYDNHSSMLVPFQNKNILIREVAPYVKDELFPYIRENKKYFPNLNTNLKSELIR